MTSRAQTAANRENARRSTGPRSTAGRARASRNAQKHGLAIPVGRQPRYASEIDALVTALVGAEPDALRRDLARQVAEATIDLQRIRAARAAAWTDADPAVALDQTAALLRLDRYERRALSRRKRALRGLDALPDKDELDAIVGRAQIRRPVTG